jgi:chemotaxis protein methyltransferase CheR
MGELLALSTYAVREFSYQPEDFKQVATLLNQLTGIKLAPSKDSMVYSRLVRRIRALNLEGFPQYLQYLDHHPEEEQHFINALTTNLTSFFREPHHFDILANYVSQHPQIKTIWCAASSTGEEPYSIAMTLAQSFGRFDHGVRIIASDIDSQVLTTAAKGVYSLDKLKGLPIEYCRQFFHRGKGANEGAARVIPELQQAIEFKKINLLDKQWPLSAPIDVIFCRNVMIYFDKPTQHHILSRMVHLLKKDGLYIAGHSENFSHLHQLVVPAGKTTYRPSPQLVTSPESDLRGSHGRI